MYQLVLLTDELYGFVVGFRKNFWFICYGTPMVLSNAGGNQWR